MDQVPKFLGVSKALHLVMASLSCAALVLAGHGKG